MRCEKLRFLRENHQLNRLAKRFNSISALLAAKFKFTNLKVVFSAKICAFYGKITNSTGWLNALILSLRF